MSAERLRAILESSFEPLRAGETPEAKLAACEADLARELAALLVREPTCDAAELAALDALAEATRERSQAVTEEVRSQHFAWLRKDRRWFKAVVDADGTVRDPELPPGVLSVPLAIVPVFYGGLRELRYGLHRRAHPSACDCAALASTKIHRKPQSPELVPTGPMTDGYYLGEGFTCRACGTRWFEGVGDGSLYSTFWEPVADPS